MSITLVAGLGNPGRDYAATRHNAGWQVLDALAAREKLSWRREHAFDAEIARWSRPDGRVLLLAKPLTFMNDSGRSVAALASYFKIGNGSIAVVYDDLAIALGRVKVNEAGGAGGHNGIASLLQHVGDGFVRFRIGIGPKQPAQMDLKDFVLGKFTPEQNSLFESKLNEMLSGLDLLLESGPARAMNTLNRRETNETDQP